MAGDAVHFQIRTLPGSDEISQSDPDPDPSTNTNTSSTHAAADLSFPPSSRRRRVLSRFVRSSEISVPSASSSAASSRNPISFNPQAAEFVPLPKMAPKRKASFPARAGKSTLSAPRTSTGNVDQPTIDSADLFGTMDIISSLNSNIFETILDDDDTNSDIFDLEMQDLRAVSQDHNQPAPHRQRVHEAFAVMRERAGEKAKPRTTSVPLQSRSALLFSYDRPTSSDAIHDTSRIRYLPLCPANTLVRRETITKDTSLTILPSVQQHIDAAAANATSSEARWQASRLPVEIFELIIDYLSRDDVKSMRMVTKEFEEKVSRALFNTSVVPFNTELYDMIDEDARVVTRASRPEGKGKGRAQDAEPQPDLRNRLQWQNAKDDAEGKVYKGHGLRVFQGFGPHIKRFGMSFEVAETQLARPPIKKELDHVQSYYGSYDWPTQQYTRFANLAGLERTADDTLRMKAAFSNLTNVRDLGLSLDSGLGWLNGPDKSIRAQIFERPSQIFGDSRQIPDHQMQEAEDLWAAILSCHRGVGLTTIPKETTLAHKSLSKPPAELKGLKGTRFAESQRWPAIAASKVVPTGASPDDAHYGVLYTTCSTGDLVSTPLVDKSALVPADLRKEQKEWLLETEWAQRAFLECYMLAVIDNPSIFENVKSINIAKLSSGFLPLLANEPFWDALPGLVDVAIHVKPDWRSVEKDNAGFAETTNQSPSEAVRILNKCILREQVCLRPSIKSLNIGWAAGGEHAEGLFARNANLLPSPITLLEQSTAVNPSLGLLVFKHVEHLTLSNCWLTPPALVELVRHHAGLPLKKLTLDSVSLTTHPRFPAGGQQQQIAQALAAFQPPAIPAAAPNAMANQQIQQQVFGQNHPVPHQGIPAWLAVNAGPGWQLPGPNAQHGAPPQVQVPPQHWLQQLAMNQAAAVFNGNPAPAPAMGYNALPPDPAASSPSSHWTAGHREGSWPELLDKVSPGTMFSDYLPAPLPWEEQLPERTTTNLETIELRSCGYARLHHNTTFDQFALDAGFDHRESNWFRTRQTALAPAMLTTPDRYLARIVQHIPQRELNALLFAWGLTEGWPDRAKAEEAEYDGHLPGGTGRVSGTIQRGMSLVAHPEIRAL